LLQWKCMKRKKRRTRTLKTRVLRKKTFLFFSFEKWQQIIEDRSKCVVRSSCIYKQRRAGDMGIAVFRKRYCIHPILLYTIRTVVFLSLKWRTSIFFLFHLILASVLCWRLISSVKFFFSALAHHRKLKVAPSQSASVNTANEQVKIATQSLLQSGKDFKQVPDVRSSYWSSYILMPFLACTGLVFGELFLEKIHSPVSLSFICAVFHPIWVDDRREIYVVQPGLFCVDPSCSCSLSLFVLFCL
jgi:hypothetical protein